MSRRDDRRGRRRLALKRETVRALSAMDLTRVAGGTYGDSAWCGSWECSTEDCDTTDIYQSAGSRYC